MTHRQLSYLHNLGIALTRCLAALLGANFRVSFSAQCWAWEVRGTLRGWALRPMVDLLFWWDHDHCRRAYQRDKKALQKFNLTT